MFSTGKPLSTSISLQANALNYANTHFFHIQHNTSSYLLHANLILYENINEPFALTIGKTLRS
jgi:hypothetical protein